MKIVCILFQEAQAGFCMPLEEVKHLDISMKKYTTPLATVECCSNISSTHLCFSYYEKAHPDMVRQLTFLLLVHLMSAL